MEIGKICPASCRYWTSGFHAWVVTDYDRSRSGVGLTVAVKGLGREVTVMGRCLAGRL